MRSTLIPAPGVSPTAAKVNVVVLQDGKWCTWEYIQNQQIRTVPCAKCGARTVNRCAPVVHSQVYGRADASASVSYCQLGGVGPANGIDLHSLCVRSALPLNCLTNVEIHLIECKYYVISWLRTLR
jgi:hypothetical protein